MQFSGNSPASSDPNSTNHTGITSQSGLASKGDSVADVSRDEILEKAHLTKFVIQQITSDEFTAMATELFHREDGQVTEDDTLSELRSNFDLLFELLVRGGQSDPKQLLAELPYVADVVGEFEEGFEVGENQLRSVRQLVFKYVGGEDPDLIGIELAFRVVNAGPMLLQISWNDELLNSLSRIADAKQALARFLNHIHETSEDWSSRVSAAVAQERLSKEFALNHRDFTQLPEFLLQMLGLDPNGQITRVGQDQVARFKERVARLSSLLYQGGEPLLIPQFRGSLEQVLEHYGNLKLKQGEWRLLVVNEGDEAPIIIPVTAGLSQEAISKEVRFFTEMRSKFLARLDAERVVPIAISSPTPSTEGLLSLCQALHLQITPALARDICNGTSIIKDRLFESTRSPVVFNISNSVSVSLGVTRDWTTETTIACPSVPRYPLMRVSHQSGTFDQDCNPVESQLSESNQAAAQRFLMTWPAESALSLSRTEQPIRRAICRSLITLLTEVHAVPKELMTMDWAVTSPVDEAANVDR